VLKLYVRVVLIAGGAVVLHSLAGLFSAPRPLEWFLFAALAILTGSFTLNIAAISASVSVADTFLITSALLFGPAPATVALALDTTIMSWRKGHPWLQVAFNAVAPALSLWVAGHTFFLLSAIRPLAVDEARIGPLIPPLLCLASVYFALNSGLMAIAVGLESRKTPGQIWDMWRRHFLWLSLGYFAAASVALCLILIIRQIGLGAVAVVLPVLAIFHHTLRASFGRLEDANRHVTQLDRLYRSTVETLAMAIDAKDDVTHSHVRRVQAYATALARELRVSDEPTLKAIEAAALLHDTGKLAVPERILNKPGSLTQAEFEEMKRHVDVGADILSLVEFPFPVVPIVRCHHESWDGSGYPRGIAGDDIPIGARILSVVDCFDALTSDRPYRARLSDQAALDILRERRGRMYDPSVVDAFIRIHRSVALDDVRMPEPLQRISRSHQTENALADSGGGGSLPPQTPADEMRPFVGLARLTGGTGGLDDVLALSTSLVREIVPAASGAWFLAVGERIAAVSAFGAAAASLEGLTMRVGEKLTGWVAANRQSIANSSAELDLGSRVSRSTPLLRTCSSTPLLAGKSLVGVLTLYSHEEAGFSVDHQRSIESVAPHIAQALEIVKAPARERDPVRPRTAVSGCRPAKRCGRRRLNRRDPAGRRAVRG
jgi:putative nucleotidyltransferase with HDIG domain